MSHTVQRRILLAALIPTILTVAYLATTPNASEEKVDLLKVANDLVNGAQGLDRLNHQGDTDLHKAVIQGDLHQVKTLVENRADLNASNVIGNTPIFFATKAGKETILRFLIESGAEVNVQNAKGATPLMFAVLDQNIEAIRILLSAGADRDVKGPNSQNALEIARKLELNDIAAFLSN